MIGKILLAAAVLTMGLAVPKAHAVVIYDWTGICDGLSCTGQATAVLTLVDTYVPGTRASTADFISFSYRSSSGAYDIPSDRPLRFIFGPAVLPTVSGRALISLDFLGFQTEFVNATGNNWLTQFIDTGITIDRGPSSEWVLRTTALSAPGPLSLLVLGLTALGLARRRRAQSHPERHPWASRCAARPEDPAVGTLRACGWTPAAKARTPGLQGSPGLA